MDREKLASFVTTKTLLIFLLYSCTKEYFQRELKKIISKGDAYFVSVPLKNNRGIPSTWNWKVEFLKAESQILAMNEPVKKMIRFLKYFRNKNSINVGRLKSYQLKCVVFNMFKDNPEIRLWCDDNLARNFVQCLKYLQHSLKQSNDIL